MAASSPAWPTRLGQRPAWGEAAAINIAHRFEDIDAHVSSSPETNEN